MTDEQRLRIRIIAPRHAGLIERAVFFVLGLVTLVTAFFFIGIALIAGAVLAGVFLLRWWWLQRKLRRAEAEGWVEGEYRVVETAVTDQRPPDERAGDPLDKS
jgi:hypothetical protein